jgi:hypothetical protein
VEGTYKFKSISYQENGNTVELQIGDKYTDGTLLSEDFLVLTLAKGGIAYLFMEDNQAVVGTWNILCHNNIDVTFNRETVIFKKDKTSLSGEIDGKNILLKKVI